MNLLDSALMVEEETPMLFVAVTDAAFLFQENVIRSYPSNQTKNESKLEFSIIDEVIKKYH